MLQGRLLVYCALLLHVCWAQLPNKASLLLSSPVHLSGSVSDQAGHPLAGVGIYHLESRRFAETDRAGHFDLRTAAPAIVFRKDGFQSTYYKSEQDADLKIVLQSGAPLMNQCEKSAACTSLQGSTSGFCLPQTRGVKVSLQNNDVDYVQRWFAIKTKRGKFAVHHASGGMWGLGLPSDEQVWSAQDYVEKVYGDETEHAIRDARGKARDGKVWRIVGHFGESASYQKRSG